MWPYSGLSARRRLEGLKLRINSVPPERQPLSESQRLTVIGILSKAAILLALGGGSWTEGGSRVSE